MLTIGPAALLALLFSTLTPSNPTDPLGSVTNTVAAVLLLLGAYAWVMRHKIQSQGTSALTAAGATTLAAATWLAVDDARRSLPPPRDPHAFYEVGVRLSDNAPISAGTAFAVTMLLIGVSLTVIASARFTPTVEEAA